jgi:hypothetical protein
LWGLFRGVLLKEKLRRLSRALKEGLEDGTMRVPLRVEVDGSALRESDE